jgi:protein SCO1/2
MNRIAIVLTACFFLLSSDTTANNTAVSDEEITIQEHLGVNIPLDVSFYNEKGVPVQLKTILDKPTIIAPVYFSCSKTCPVLLINLADVLNKVNLVPGKDFQIFTISFDERDTPRLAAEKKPNYLKRIKKPFPVDAWRFLTGDIDNIRRFSDAIGFKYKKNAAGFIHPVALIFISPKGKIVRYLNGATFLPFELEMAVTEASRGRAVSVARKALLYCMSYDPEGKRYVFNTLRVVAILIITTLGSFLIYLLVTDRKHRKDGTHDI